VLLGIALLAMAIPMEDQGMAPSDPGQLRPTPLTTPRPRASLPKQTWPDPGSLIRALEEVGLTRSEPWSKSSYDGVWTAVQRRSFGANEVSSLVESSTGDCVQSITLEAEFHSPGLHTAELLSLLINATVAVDPSAPEPLLEAMSEQRPWSNERWSLSREPHAGGGYDLRLRSISLAIAVRTSDD
jgi:hypothetical protein